MRPTKPLTCLACLLGLAIPSFASHTHRGPTSARASHHHTVKAHLLGQRGIDDARATQLQAALIKAGYLNGAPSGHWDAAAEAAMTKLQADNGWQTKLVPDSRAIIKLGLGPNSATSASAATSSPDLTGSVAPVPSSTVAMR